MRPKDLVEKDQGVTRDLGEATHFAFKIVVHIILDLIVIITIMVGLHIIKQLSDYLGLADDIFMNVLMKYSESAAILVYIVFVGISIIGVLRKEILVKLLAPLMKSEINPGEKEND